MDNAPLTKAQNSARHATSPEQHHKAALEYSTAAQGVEDTEALRILALLEQHHQRLASIVRAQAGQSVPPADDASQNCIESSAVSQEQATTLHEPLQSQGLAQSNARRPPSPVLQRRPVRELSSTIASNLATARGIPNTQQQSGRQSSPASSVKGTERRLTAQQHRASASSTPRTSESAATSNSTQHRSAAKSEQTSQTNVKPSQSQTRLDEAADGDGSSAKDDAFQKFYSTFEGLLSKLSAPLAFAGLPLRPEDQSHADAGDKLVASNRSAAPDGPDVTKLFSKAALRAVKEDNPGFGGVQESFFVVPTGGGTVSYAGILSRQERHARQQSMEQPLGQDEDASADHFVDAKSSPQSRSPKESRKSIVHMPRTASNKTMEELEVENESLKQLTDNLSRRLYMWEKSAQSQSLALQQSIKTLQPPSQALQETEVDQHDVSARLKELEDQLATSRQEMQRYERENEKLKTVVARYRERWEKLKEGARVRREGTDKGNTDAVQNES